MTVYPGCLSRAGMQKLWVECPALLDLKFMRTVGGFMSGAAVLHEEDFVPSHGVHPESATTDSSDQVSEILPALRLRILHIHDVTLPGSLETMLQRIDALTLRVMTLNVVPGTSRIFEALASRFQQSEPALSRLYILGLGQQTADTLIANLPLLLTSFSGLEDLKLQCLNCDKLGVDGIVNHGETLKTLFVVNGTIHREDRDR
jgi:hypothetical protein